MLGFHAPAITGFAQTPSSPKPNIVFALIDDLGWSNTEFGGSAYHKPESIANEELTTFHGITTTADYGLIKTPVMKSLAKDSIKLNYHYAYAWCAPSRSSLLSGRIPTDVNVVHANPIGYVPESPEDSGEGIPAGMKTVGTMLQEAGYKTHYNGKWGVGYTWKKQTPMHRGYDSHLVYLHDSADYWDLTMSAKSIEVPGGCEKYWRNKTLYHPEDCGFLQANAPKVHCAPEKLPFDLIKNGEPAYDIVGNAWVDEIFLKESLENIRDHDTAYPFFLLHSFHAIHAPLNGASHLYNPKHKDGKPIADYGPVPCRRDDWDPNDKGNDPMAECFGPFAIGPNENYTETAGGLQVSFGPKRDPARRSYAAYVTFVDGAIGDMIDALKVKNMWDNTLMVVSSDNGGPQYLSSQGYQKWGSGNNLPLRGGKISEFEGGIRVNSFVVGGFVPPSVRGTESNALIQFADWYMTFCELAGHKGKYCKEDEMARKNELPQPSGFNQWPYLTGAVKEMPRKELLVSVVTLIQWPYKLLTGADPGSIAEHGKPGYVPFPHYATGYFTMYPNREDQPPGAVLASWETFCDPLATGVQKAASIAFIMGLVNLNPEYYWPDESNTLWETLCTPGYDCRNGCLFNIETDPNETEDLASTHVEILEAMKEKLNTTASHDWSADEPWGVFRPRRNNCAPDQFDETCSDFGACARFLEKGAYNFVADEASPADI